MPDFLDLHSQVKDWKIILGTKIQHFEIKGSTCLVTKTQKHLLRKKEIASI